MEETLKGYYHVLAQILRNYGAPAEILTDRRTLFESNRKESSPSTENPLTRFGHACKTLGTQLSVTSVPQAKGRVERLIETLQDRLQSELRLNQIKTISEANQFLKIFLERFNKRFASNIKNNMSVFDKQLTLREIDKVLIIANERSVDHGHCIKFENKRYLPISGTEFIFLQPHTKVLVIKSFSGKLYLTTDDDHVYQLFCVPKYEFRSTLFDEQVVPETRRGSSVPAITHPWRRMNYRDYLVTLGVSERAARDAANKRYPKSKKITAQLIAR
jgi:hypothetical protein